jgi:hypothetical protein
MVIYAFGHNISYPLGILLFVVAIVSLLVLARSRT